MRRVSEGSTGEAARSSNSAAASSSGRPVRVFEQARDERGRPPEPETLDLPWFSDEWLVSEGDVIGLTRDEVRALAHRRDRQWLRDGSPGTGDQQPFFGS
jgi:hypothetical protein